MPHFKSAEVAKANAIDDLEYYATDVDETESEDEGDPDEIPQVPANETFQEKKVRVRRELRNLHAKLKKCHGYQSYRAKALRDAENGVEHGTWPERVHQAFLEGSILWPAGHAGGSRGDGRNKEIAIYIERKTDVERDRKQISSHKQVIAGFFETSDRLMSYYMGKKPQTGPRRPNRRHVGPRNTRRDRRGESAEPSSSSANRGRPSPLLSEQLAAIKADLNVFKPAVFRMFIYKGRADEEPGPGVGIMHTYTSTQNAPHHFVDSVRGFGAIQKDDPLLAELHLQNPLVCNVLMGSITLAFPARDFTLTQNVKLATEFFCTSQGLPVGTELLCYNKIYQDTTLIDSSGPETVTLFKAAGEEHPATALKFSKDFWARKLKDIAASIRKAPSNAYVQGIKHDVQRLVMIQEINIMTTTGEERLMVVYWRFRMSTHQTGRAVWRRVIMRDEINVNTLLTEPKLYNHNNATTPPVVAGPSRSNTLQSQGSHSSLTSTLVNSIVEDLKYDTGIIPSTMSEGLFDMTLHATSGPMFSATSIAEGAIDPSLGYFPHHWEPQPDPYSMASFMPGGTPSLSQQQIPYPILSRPQPQLAPSPPIIPNVMHHRQYSQTEQVPQQAPRYWFAADTEDL